MGRPGEPHICWGCSKPIDNDQPHIHIPLDDWGMRNGLESLGLGDDDLMMPFCEPCTVEDPRGWQLEAHAVRRNDAEHDKEAQRA